MRTEEEGPTRDLMRLTARSKVADLIVAALAQHLDADLKTTNLKHSPMLKGLKAPY